MKRKKDAGSVSEMEWDVIVVGGGNAALCLAIMAAEAGRRVLVLESAPEVYRGDNSRHTRNFRCMHQGPLSVLTDAYEEDEYFDDLMLVTKGVTDETMARMVFGMEAPYGIFSLPKLFGIPGGILLCVGTVGLAHLKVRAEKELGTARVWGGEMAFIALLFFVSLSGLVLYAATGTAAVPTLLALHLGSVLAFFLLMPYSKMVHGFFRFTALVREAQLRNAMP